LLRATRIATIWAAMYHTPMYSVKIYKTERLIPRLTTLITKNDTNCLGISGALFLKVQYLLSMKLWTTATVNPIEADTMYQVPTNSVNQYSKPRWMIPPRLPTMQNFMNWTGICSICILFNSPYTLKGLNPSCQSFTLSVYQSPSKKAVHAAFGKFSIIVW
jgi:hypothetical protein